MIKHVLRLITARFQHKSPRLIGECNLCGECCRRLTLSDAGKMISKEEEYRALVLRHPEYRIFRPSHHDPQEGLLYFTCSQLGEDNRCRIHAQRPDICRIYPNSKMFDYGARLPKACGYRLAPQSEFNVVFDAATLRQKQKSRRN